MSQIKKLFSQTAYYGISSILGRMLYYALVPLHTRVLNTQSDYGIVGELYAYVTFLNILFLYGMETAFFRFSNKSENKQEVYNQTFSIITSSSILFAALLFLFAQSINGFLSEGDTQLYRIEYIQMFIGIMFFDALSTMPFAKLRLENKALKFASIRFAGIFVNVVLNLFYLLLCPYLITKESFHWISAVYAPHNEIYYIFLSNLVASFSVLLFLYKEIISARWSLVWTKIKPMLLFSMPLLIGGLAGMMNETLDRILLKYLLPGTISERLSQIGIYNAAYKLSIFMTLAIQAFRMAAEPFFFSINKDVDSKEIYAKTMNYFVLACAFIYLGVVLHLDMLAYILGPLYREGLHVVPILLFANLFLGIYINLSIWFKVTDKTKYGAYITLLGAAITIILNIYWIPIYGYLGSAYATLICYFVMAIVCYIYGQKYFKVPYNINIILKYILIVLGVSILSYMLERYIQDGALLLKQIIRSVLFLIFTYYAWLEIKMLKK